MKILFDFTHIGSINFFKTIINQLHDEGHEVFFSVLNRGKLPEIIKKEYPDYKMYIVGRHRGSWWSILIEANVIRFFRMWRLCNKINPDVALSFGGFLVGAVMRIKGKFNIQITDDPERKIAYFLQKLTANEMLLTDFSDENKHKIRYLNALKEWAYLSPRYFIPDKEVLDEYALKEKKYIFVREVSIGSLNYKKQQKGIIQRLSGNFPVGFKVLLSLEDKRMLKDYPSDWIILEEPVCDIYSLMYYSRFLISSGDSMAREGAVLGVPSIYCGIRDMAANKIMIEYGTLAWAKTNQDFTTTVEGIIQGNSSLIHNHENFRNHLLEKWDDMNLYIKNRIDKQLEEKKK